MANMMDYLDWRGDIPFSADPFGEVDNLLLAQAAYVEYDGIVPGEHSDETIKIKDVVENFFRMHRREEVLARDTFTNTAPFLLEKMAKSRRFEHTRLGGYVNSISAENGKQMSAVTFFLEDGSAYAAFRGTDDTIAGWKEDLNLSFLTQTPGQKHAADYLSAYFDRPLPAGRLLRVGGHSKGGNFAVYAAAFCAPSVRDRIRQVYSNDGPGFLETLTRTEEFRQVLPLVYSIIPEGSFFGLLLTSGYAHHIVKSDQKGVYQHDAMSWQILGNAFVPADVTTQESVFMERTMADWINGISLSERERFVDAIYELLTSGGAQTVSGLGADTIRGKLEMLRSFAAMPSEEQRVIRERLTDLIRSGISTLTRDLSGSGSTSEEQTYRKTRT